MTPEEATIAAYRTLLDPADQRARLIWADLAAACHAGETTHVAGDPHASAFREGKRAVFLYLAGRLSVPVLPEV
jgi:hypothetical protein